MTSHKLGEESCPEGEVLVFSVLSIAGHLGLSTLVTYYTWPIVFALFMSSCLPHLFPHMVGKKRG